MNVYLTSTTEKLNLVKFHSGTSTQTSVFSIKMLNTYKKR